MRRFAALFSLLLSTAALAQTVTLVPLAEVPLKAFMEFRLKGLSTNPDAYTETVAAATEKPLSSWKRSYEQLVAENQTMAVYNNTAIGSALLWPDPRAKAIDLINFQVLYPFDEQKFEPAAVSALLLNDAEEKARERGHEKLYLVAGPASVDSVQAVKNAGYSFDSEQILAMSLATGQKQAAQVLTYVWSKLLVNSTAVRSKQQQSHKVPLEVY